MKRIVKITFLAVALLYSSSCRDYLDIVPDNVVTLESYFERREMAWNALSKVYSFLPDDIGFNSSSWMLGDEIVGQISEDNNSDALYGIRLMRGLQNSSSPLLGLWPGSGGGKAMYQGIRAANMFLDNIDLAEDMEEEEIRDWKAQVKFLKAYFHFLLLRQYGPIVIADKSIPLDALAEDLFLKRSKVEDCFDYIIRLMDEAIADLQVDTEVLELGRINKAIAASIKARILLYRASPFYNGNSLYYVDFLDFDGEPFFPMEYDHEKWKVALDAIDTAIVYCENNGIELYEFDKAVYPYDRDDYAVNEEAIQTLYNLRMLIMDPWNKELIWGQTYNQTRDDILPSYCNIRLPKGYDNYGGATDNNASSWQAGAASYAAMERYYTKNGLPIDYDKTFNKSTMYDIVSVPAHTDGDRYTRIRGIMKPGERTVRMYMDREPRFYANLGVTGSYWRAHALRIDATMLATTAGGYNPVNFLPFFLVTGIGVQKLVHPESKSGGWTRVIRCPQPIIRMADLYLMRAEALNEYYGVTAHAEAYKEINKVRRRAGIPDLEVVWSDPNLTRQVGRHTTQAGLRAIIFEERGNEFAFEGMRFWDMYRNRSAVAAFSAPIMGWNYKQAYISEFFIPTIVQTRRFLIRDYLWPISVGEINKNSNLIQNPGW